MCFITWRTWLDTGCELGGLCYYLEITNYQKIFVLAKQNDEVLSRQERLKAVCAVSTTTCATEERGEFIYQPIFRRHDGIDTSTVTTDRNQSTDTKDLHCESAQNIVFLLEYHEHSKF